MTFLSLFQVMKSVKPSKIYIFQNHKTIKNSLNKGRNKKAWKSTTVKKSKKKVYSTYIQKKIIFCIMDHRWRATSVLLNLTSKNTQNHRKKILKITLQNVHSNCFHRNFFLNFYIPSRRGRATTKE